MGKPRIFSGARAIVKINDQLVVYAMNVSYNIRTMYAEISTIDNPVPDEYAPTNIRVDLSITNLRVPRESAAVLAYQPTIFNTLHQGYLSIELRDRGTNEILLYIPQAVLVNRSGVVGIRQLASETWQLRGVGYWDERPPSEAAKNGPQTGTTSPESNINKVTGGLTSTSS